MSWTSIRTYFNARCEEQGLSEWADAFNTDDIPSTSLDQVYHVQFGDFTGEGQNQSAVETLVNVTVQFFIKGFATPKDAVDSAISNAQSIVKASLLEGNRLSQPFKNVLFTNMAIEPFAESNDNIARARLQFTVRAVLDPAD
jgi:hypothetical protein